MFETSWPNARNRAARLRAARGSFDPWIDAAEEAYADIALSPEFREVYGALVNAQMRLRAGVQKEVELAGAMFGMPTRTEVDSAHRKIAELERALRACATRNRCRVPRRAAGSETRGRHRRPSPPRQNRPAAVKPGTGRPAPARNRW